MLARIMMVLTLVMLISSPLLLAAQKPDDREALSGLKAAKVIFDVRVDDLDKLMFNLKLFRETFDGMEPQGVKPDMIVAFRGPGVKLLTATALDAEALELIRALKKKGVRFEVCAVALRIFKVDPAGLVPEVKVVANVFNSLIGYQSKGYAMIVIN